jgi:hypothetical protein
VDFTREPIIETIISPKEGCKLLVRSSKSADGAEEYHVDALEVVSFGNAFFFRSLEKPKPFLVPTSDYEVLEVKEPRVMLKAAVHERNIKIGGGREAPVRQAPREAPAIESATVEEEVVSSSSEEAESEEGSYARMDRRRDRRRRRHRRDDQEWTGGPRQPQEAEGQQPSSETQGGEARPAVAQPYPTLIPPPSTLISQTLSRYKENGVMPQTPVSDKPTSDKPFLPEEMHGDTPPAPEAKEPAKPKPAEDDSGEGTSTLQRATVDPREAATFSSTYRTPVFGEHDPYFF